MRRALTLCSSVDTVSRLFIEKSLGCTKVLANLLLERLEFEGFVLPTEELGVFSVDAAQLNEYGWLNYFPVDENKENGNEVNYQNSLPAYSPTQESVVTVENAMNVDNYVPESNDNYYEARSNAKHSKPEDYGSSSAFNNNGNYSDENDSPVISDITNVESSIRK
ncbi:hypothetical protein JTE90_023695, partial [Oedothorax gibbosus]